MYLPPFRTYLPSYRHTYIHTYLGAFYVWTKAEVDDALGPQHSTRFAQLCDVR